MTLTYSFFSCWNAFSYNGFFQSSESQFSSSHQILWGTRRQWAKRQKYIHKFYIFTDVLQFVHYSLCKIGKSYSDSFLVMTLLHSLWSYTASTLFRVAKIVSGCIQLTPISNFGILSKDTKVTLPSSLCCILIWLLNLWLFFFLKAVEAEKYESFEMKNLVAAVERKSKKMESNNNVGNALSASKYPATPCLPATTASSHAVTAPSYSTPSQLNDVSMSWDYYDMRPIPTPGRDNSLELEF